jgi:hypothetical protein
MHARNVSKREIKILQQRHALRAAKGAWSSERRSMEKNGTTFAQSAILSATLANRQLIGQTQDAALPSLSRL